MTVFLSVPTRGQIQWQTVTVLESIRDKNPNLPPVLYQEGNLSVALTRNKIVRKFLKTSAETLVMIDDDTVPSPHFLEVLTPVPEGYGMVGLPYPTVHNGSLGFTAYRRKEAGYEFVTSFSKGWNDVDGLGTGCVAIPRTTLVELGPDPFRIEVNPEADVTSDDLLFCRDLQKKQLKIGVWWDGWYADHIRAVGLAPLAERFLKNG